jgi:hypothetical protein
MGMTGTSSVAIATAREFSGRSIRLLLRRFKWFGGG